MAQGRKGSYYCYQKASTGVELYADRKNPDKKESESHQLTVAVAAVTQELLKMEEASGGSHTYYLITVKLYPDGTASTMDLSPGFTAVLSVIEIPSSFTHNEMEKGHYIYFSVLAELVINFDLTLMRGKKPDIIHVKKSHWIDRHLNQFIVIGNFAANLASRLWLK